MALALEARPAWPGAEEWLASDSTVLPTALINRYAGPRLTKPLELTATIKEKLARMFDHSMWLPGGRPHLNLAYLSLLLRNMPKPVRDMDVRRVTNYVQKDILSARNIVCNMFRSWWHTYSYNCPDLPPLEEGEWRSHYNFSRKQLMGVLGGMPVLEQKSEQTWRLKLLNRKQSDAYVSDD